MLEHLEVTEKLLALAERQPFRELPKLKELRISAQKLREKVQSILDQK